MFVALLTSLLSACGALHQPASCGSGGNSSRDIDATTVRINYLGGATADVDTIKNYALYRAAELTLERGFEGFVLLKSGAYSVGGGGAAYTTSATLTIRLFKSAAPGNSTWPAEAQGVYDAKGLRASLEAGIKRAK